MCHKDRDLLPRRLPSAYGHLRVGEREAQNAYTMNIPVSGAHFSAHSKNRPVCWDTHIGLEENYI